MGNEKNNNSVIEVFLERTEGEMGCNDPPAAPGGGGGDSGDRHARRPPLSRRAGRRSRELRSGRVCSLSGLSRGQGSHFTTSNAPLPAMPISSVYTFTFTFKLPSDLLPFRTESILRTTDYAGKNSNHSSSSYYYHIITMGKL